MGWSHMFTLQTSPKYYILMCHYIFRLSYDFFWRFLRIFLNISLVLLVDFINLWSFLNISQVLELLFLPSNYPELFSLSCLEKASNIKISGTKWKVFTLSKKYFLKNSKSHFSSMILAGETGRTKYFQRRKYFQNIFKEFKVLLLLDDTCWWDG